MKKIITISREFGAGGGEIGRQLAERLNLEYYDKELILKAARSHNVDVGSMVKWDEKVPMDFGFAQSLFDFYNRPLNEKLFEAQKNVIREIGEKGNCVIVGRNANVILKEFDHAMHVFIHADSSWRMRRMKEKMPESSEAKIIERIKEVDKARKKYCTYYTDTVFGASECYDVSLNTASFGIESCVDILCKLAEG